jgi:hypothetical protein
MNIEELLYPRYKITERWPDMGLSGYYVGQIVTLRQKDNDKWCKIQRDLTIYEAFFQGYPHLFEPLPWWKDRKVEDMPEYVKDIPSGKIFKMVNWTINTTGVYYDDIEQCNNCIMFFMNNMLPATEADYNAYLQTTNQNNG